MCSRGLSAAIPPVMVIRKNVSAGILNTRRFLSETVRPAGIAPVGIATLNPRLHEDNPLRGMHTSGGIPLQGNVGAVYPWRGGVYHFF